MRVLGGTGGEGMGEKKFLGARALPRPVRAEPTSFFTGWYFGGSKAVWAGRLGSTRGKGPGGDVTAVTLGVGFCKGTFVSRRPFLCGGSFSV